MNEVIRFAFLGLGLGALYSLASQGLVLIYRGSGVLNFGQGAVGMVGAFVAWEFQIRHGVPFLAAFVIGVLASAALGALTHLLVMRQLRRASPLARIVATLGVLILLESAAVLRYGPTLVFTPTELPQKVLHLWGDVILPVDRLILLGIAAFISIVLWALYKYTRFGIGTEAVAENQRAASALGWSADMIATVNWALGAGLAGVAAILVAPIATLQVSNMTNLVIAAMAAALVAQFRSFPIAFAAGMTIGIAQTEVSRFWGEHPGADKAVPFVVIVAFLVITGRALPLRDFFLQRLPAVGSGRIRPGLVLLGIGATILLIEFASITWIDSLIVTFGTALILLSIVVLTGYAGQLSLAQFAIAGIGALFAGRISATQHWPFWATFLCGIVGTIPVGVLFALPAVRTRGINLAVVTLGLGTAVDLVIFNNSGWTGGFTGTVVEKPTLFGWDMNPVTHNNRYAYFCLGCFVVAGLVVANVRRSRSGRRLLAVRTNERAAAALGINVPGAKLYAFALSAAIAAVGGILIAFQTETIQYNQTFPNFTSITDVGWAFLGGIGYLFGPILGATFAPGTIGTAISDALFSGVTRWLPFIGGIILLAIVLGNQDGMVKESIKQYAWIGRKIGKPVEVLKNLPLFRDPPTPPLPAGERRPVVPQTLEVRDLTMRYGAVLAVESLSLTLRPGRILGLIGPNGAGKTTAIDGITGFTAPASGSVLLDGASIDRWSVVRRTRSGISRSFQSLELFEDATVLDNLRVASDPRDWLSYVRDVVYPVTPPLPVEVVAAIKEFGLEESLHKHVESLPYGQRRLLAIARAIATRPSVLLLDEPAAGLSETESGELARLVRRLADEWGMAILLIEHDVNFVMTVCDEIVVLDFGRTISAGSPDEVRGDPAVIAAYLGEAETPEHGKEVAATQLDGHG